MRNVRGSMLVPKRLTSQLIAACICVAGLSSTPARATDWDSVAGWDVYEVDARRCVVGRAFAEGPTTFGIILSLDSDTRVFATRAGWTMRTGSAVPAGVLLDGQALQSGSSVGIEQGENRGFVAAVPASFLDRFATAAQLGLIATPGQAAHALRLTGAAAGLAQGRRCLDNLREEARLRLATTSRPVAGWPTVVGRQAAASVRPSVASAVPRAVASPASPRRPKSSWVTAEDYPDAALRAEEEGSVTVKLAINRVGEVAACDVLRSSGSSALDAATCRTVRRRARYQPATDGAGQPVDTVDNHTVRWTLPR